MTTGRPPSRSGWLASIRRYLLAVTLGNLIWETAQLPLYTLWRTGTERQIASAILHCTVGDLVIAAVGLVAALALVGSPNWPDQRMGAVIVAVVIGSVGYTIYSEYVNTTLQRSWAYTAWMPRLPWLGTGLSPLAQWLIIPTVALSWAGRAVSAHGQRPPRHEQFYVRPRK
jgi:hypothetical protein